MNKHALSVNNSARSVNARALLLALTCALAAAPALAQSNMPPMGGVFPTPSGGGSSGGGGCGGGGITGTGAVNEITFWTGATTVSGTSALQFNASGAANTVTLTNLFATFDAASTSATGIAQMKAEADNGSLIQMLTFGSAYVGSYPWGTPQMLTQEIRCSGVLGAECVFLGDNGPLVFGSNNTRDVRIDSLSGIDVDDAVVISSAARFPGLFSLSTDNGLVDNFGLVESDSAVAASYAAVDAFSSAGFGGQATMYANGSTVVGVDGPVTYAGSAELRLKSYAVAGKEFTAFSDASGNGWWLFNHLQVFKTTATTTDIGTAGTAGVSLTTTTATMDLNTVFNASAYPAVANTTDLGIFGQEWSNIRGYNFEAPAAIDALANGIAWEAGTAHTALSPFNTGANSIELGSPTHPYALINAVKWATIGTGVEQWTEQAAPAVSSAGFSTAYADSTAHCVEVSSNGGGYSCLATTGSSSGGIAFVQNGNSFGVAAVLGTNDAKSLSFETNNVTQETIASTGGFSYPGLLTQGTWFNAAYASGQTLSSNMNGFNIDLNTNITNVNRNVIGFSTTLPSASGMTTSTMRGMQVSPGSLVNASGTSTWRGFDVTLPSITQTSGTLTADGVRVTVPSTAITTGGTLNAFDMPTVTTGPAVGVLNAINIGNITTPGSGTETAIQIGSGWDNGVNNNAPTWTMAVDTNFALTGGVNGLSFDGTTFSVDGLNNRIGIGTAAPAVELDVVGSFQDSGNSTFGDASGDSFTFNAASGSFVNSTIITVKNNVGAPLLFTASDATRVVDVVAGKNTAAGTTAGADLIAYNDVNDYAELAALSSTFTTSRTQHSHLSEFVASGTGGLQLWSNNATPGAITMALGAPGADTVYFTLNAADLNFTTHLSGVGGSAAADATTGTCTAVTVTGTDLRGTITATCTATQTVIVNFGTAYTTTAPFCVTSAATSATTTTGVMTVTALAALTAIPINYVCVK